MARLDSFLRLVVEQKASDLHFMAGHRPLIRHDGLLVPIPFRELTDIEARRFLFEILSTEQRARLDAEEEVDFAYDLAGVGRFRANVFLQSDGMGAVFRVIPEEPPNLSDLRLPSAVRKILDLPNGLVLFCGPTGCGKSTTQAALIHELNRTRPLHIITIEDPIEFIHPPKKAVLTQRQVGKHVATFEHALRSALRESPDVVLVGELRDLETIQLALSAAETGVLVFGTLHTGSAAKSIGRIIDAFPDTQADQIRGVLSVIVRAVVSQRVKPGMVMMYHAQEKIVNTPGSEKTGKRGGIHNSVTRATVKPTHMIGGYAQQSYGFNYYGTVGSNRDEFVVIRKMKNVDWLDRPAKTEAAE